MQCIAKQNMKNCRHRRHCEMILTTVWLDIKSANTYINRSRSSNSSAVIVYIQFKSILWIRLESTHTHTIIGWHKFLACFVFRQIHIYVIHTSALPCKLSHANVNAVLCLLTLSRKLNGELILKNDVTWNGFGHTLQETEESHSLEKLRRKKKWIKSNGWSWFDFKIIF